MLSNDVKVWFIADRHGVPFHSECPKVFLHKSDAENALYGLNRDDVYLDSVMLPFAGRYIYQLRLYRGFDYYPEMHHVCTNLDFVPTIGHIRNSAMWKHLHELADNNPELYNVHASENRICSRDYNGEDWIYGDVMEGKLSAEVVKFRVYH